MSKFVCIYHVKEQILRKKFEISCNLSLDAMEVSEQRGLHSTDRWAQDPVWGGAGVWCEGVWPGWAWQSGPSPCACPPQRPSGVFRRLS